MNNNTDILFNKFFVESINNTVSFINLLDKLNLNEEELISYLNYKNLEIEEEDGSKYLVGYKYRDETRTPIQSSMIGSKQSLFQSIKSPLLNNNTFNNSNTSNTFLQKKLSKEYNKELEDNEFDNLKKKMIIIDNENKALKIKNKKLQKESLSRLNIINGITKLCKNNMNEIVNNLEDYSGEKVSIVTIIDIANNGRFIITPDNLNYNFVVDKEYDSVIHSLKNLK
jgi:hypothetical protein